MEKRHLETHVLKCNSRAKENPTCFDLDCNLVRLVAEDVPETPPLADREEMVLRLDTAMSACAPSSEKFGLTFTDDQRCADSDAGSLETLGEATKKLLQNVPVTAHSTHCVTSI